MSVKLHGQNDRAISFLWQSTKNQKTMITVRKIIAKVKFLC